MHSQENTAIVNGQTVTINSIIGQMGETGSATTPHLHLQIANSASDTNSHAKTENPLKYYPNIAFTGLAENHTEY
jgi:murein DD-endopeptidase MepM/ murein hydrolase activator NlpD